jgi:hypothetical protein
VFIPDGYLLHPYGLCLGTPHQQMLCKGYNSYSGALSDIGELGILTSVIAGITIFWKKHNCHTHRCLRLSWHYDADNHPVCKPHSDEHPKQPGRVARLITKLRGPHDGYLPPHMREDGGNT